MNQEELVSTFAKAMCRIADCLPRQELNLLLYPTRNIKQAVAKLYAYLIDFLVKALHWYQEGKVKHIIHAITQPVKIRYKDILENIEECSRNIDRWAASSAHAELRDMHNLQQKTQIELDNTGTIVRSSATTTDEIMRIVVSMTPQLTKLVAGQLNTNQRVFDLQLSQMLAATANSRLQDPEISYRSGILRRNKHRARCRNWPPFYHSAKLRDWTTSQTSSLVVVRGPYSLRDQAKMFGVNVIEAMRSASIPVLWMIPSAVQRASGLVTSIDLLKSLVQQAMRINRHFQSENACALSCARIQSAVNESDWFDILGSVLIGLPLVYVVLDSGLLGREGIAHSGNFAWPLAFFTLFQRLAYMDSCTVVKVLIINYYKETDHLCMTGVDEPQNYIVTIDSRRHSAARYRSKARSKRLLHGNWQGGFVNRYV